MERIPGKKGKRRIPASAVIIAVLILLSIFSLYFAVKYTNENSHDVLIKNIIFQDETDDNVYVIYDVINKVNISKECSINMSILNGSYLSNISLKPLEKITNKVFVVMPKGKTSVKINYLCS